MRTAAFLGVALLALAGCAGGDDHSSTDDSAEINEARGTLERSLDPPIAVPKSPAIGAAMADVLAKATGAATAKPPKSTGDDCKQTRYENAGALVATHVECATSEIVRSFAKDGSVLEEHFDLNKDGKVDRYANPETAVVTLGDTNYDGNVDLVIERVDRLEDFSMKGYEETYPRSSFLHRVREDRNHDGKFEFERLTAKGALPPKTP